MVQDRSISHQSIGSNTRIILVRHGRTNFNVRGKVQGGGSLDAVGLVQASALADHLRETPIAMIYTSPAIRAVRTAQFIAEPHQLKIIKKKELSDLNYGIFRNMLLPIARKTAPTLWAQWDQAPQSVKFPGGESLLDLRLRVLRFMEAAIDRHPNVTILAVTHDSVIRSTISVIRGEDDSSHNVSGLSVGVGSVTVIEFTDSGACIINQGSVEHLEGINEG